MAYFASIRIHVSVPSPPSLYNLLTRKKKKKHADKERVIVDKGTIVNEHVHHHIHHIIQPVIEKESKPNIPFSSFVFNYH
jgi:hypothetical protein